MNKDLELALRVKADFEAGQRELDKLNSAISNVGRTATDTAASTDQISESIRDLNESVDKTETSTSRAASSFDQWNRTFAQTARDLEDWQAANNGALRSMEDIAAQEERLDRLMAQGAISMEDYEKSLTKLDAAEAKLNKEHQAHDRELNKVLRTADKTAAELKKLTNDAAKLDDALKRGKITQQEYERAMAGIARRRRDIDAASTSLGRMGFHSRQARSELITLGRSLATGNFTGAATDIARMSQRVDGASMAFARFAIPTAAAVGVVGAFAAVSYQAWQDQRELQNVLILTNTAAGLTVGSFSELTQEIERNSNATIAQSREIALELMRTGRYSEGVIASYGRSIAILQQLTGRTAAELVAEFGRMENGIASWAAKQNETWRFLTAEQYANIRALEERGDIEAAQLAVSEAITTAYADKVDESLGLIERAWINAKKSASEYWQAVKDIGRSDTETQIASLRKELEAANREYRASEFLGWGGLGRAVVAVRGAFTDTDELQNRIAGLEEQLADERLAAADAAESAEREAQAIIASQRIAQLELKADREKQMQAELKKLRDDFAAAREVFDDPAYSDESLAKLEKQITERYRDKSGDAAAKAAENYVKNLERQAAAVELTAAEVRALALAEKELTTEQRQRAERALSDISADEQRKQAEKDAQQLATLQIQLLRAQGNEAEAARMEYEQRFETMLSALSESSKEAGREIISNLLDLESLRQQLALAEKEISKVLARQQQQETSINAQREAGLITEGEARRRIVELHRQTSAELEKQRPILEELAQQPGAVGEAAAATLAQLNAQAEQLNATMNLFAATMSAAVEGGLTEAIAGLAKGTQSFQEAIRSLAQTVLNAIIQINAQQIAQSITSSAGGWVSAIGSFMGYATGGYTGHGGKYQVAGIVHKGEGVLDQEDIAALGGPAGFFRLREALRNGYADGGLVGVPAPAMPSPTLGNSRIPEPAAAFNATVQTSQTFNLIDDPQRIADAFNTPAGEEAITVMISRNPGKFRSLLGVN